MKGNSKLFSIVIALAMVLSIVVMPANVGAAVSETNMFGTMPFDEDGSYAPGASSDGQVTVQGADEGWRQGKSTSVITYDKNNDYVSVTKTEAGTDIKYNYSNSQPNKTYIVSAYIKLAASGASANAQVKVGIANTNYNLLPSPTAVNASTALNSDTWTYVYGQFAYGDALTTKGTNSKGEEIDRQSRGAHYEFYVDSAVNYYIRDIKMIDVTDGINLLHNLNSGFESGILDSTNQTTKSNATVSTAAAHTGKYGVEVTTTDAHEDIRYINISSVTNNQWYRGSVWVKADSASVGKKAQLVARTNGTNEAVRLYDETLLTADWQKLEVEFKFPTSGKKIHMGPQIESDAKVYVDDFCLEAFTPDTFTATMTPGTAGIKSAEIAVAFSAAPTSFTAANVEAEGATVAVTGADKNYTISLTGLTPDTTYSVALKDVTDKYSQVLGTTNVSVTTAEKIAPVSDNIIVAAEITQANGRSDYTGTGPSVTGEWTIDKSVAEFSTDEVQCINQTVELSKKYLVSVKIKNNDVTPDLAATATVTASESGSSKHAIDAVMVASDTSIASSDWVEVTGIVTVKNGITCDCGESGCTKANSLMHFGVKTASNQKFQLKDLTLTELTPLGYDSNYFAAIKDNGDGTASLYITNSAEDSKVYFVAASYEGEKLADVKLARADVNEFAAAMTIDVPENYTVFIWNSNFNPLNKKFLGSDF
ncbi:MAG: carbohydrate binding domain-containing protein [Clostridia bacterium]|nr:carbohydrate binding domain-containing protein [Clostridia bacterium]